MKKLFAMLLALTMTFQLITPAWAEAAAEEPEAATDTSVTVSEPEKPESTEGETPEELPEKTTAEQEKTQEGNSQENGQSPIEPQTQAGEESGESQTCRVIFHCTPADLTLVVIPKDGDVDQAIEPQEDGSYLLEAGDYAYLAAAEGYQTAEGYFTVADAALSVRVVLTETVETKEQEVQKPLTLEEGQCGANAFWTLDDQGLLSITGEGAMYDYSFVPADKRAPWYAERAKIQNVKIGENITYLGDYAFYDCSSSIKVFFPENIHDVGNKGFDYFKEGSVLFCASKQTPSGWESRWDCTLVCGVDEKQADFWMSLDKNATKIQIPEGIQEIYSGAFRECSKLEYVDIPQSVTTIRYDAFRGTNLQMLYIPKSVQTIEGESEYRTPFSGCSSELILVCEADSRQQGWGVCWNASGGTKLHVYYAKAKQEVDAWSTVDKSASKIVLPDGITFVPYAAFKDKANITEITLPDSLREIDELAFAGCTGLWTLYIPAGVERIRASDDYRSPFYQCNTDLKLICGAQEAGENWGRYYRYCSYKKTLRVVFGLTMQEFKYWDTLSDKTAEEVVIQDGITTIPESAFSGWANLRSVTVPESVRVIQDSAFKGCTALEIVTMGDGVTTLGSSAFENCTSLQSIALPDTIAKMGYRTFGGCTALESITLPQQLQVLEASTFSGCINLKSIDLKNVTSIENSALGGCTGLQSLYIPNQVTSIASGAFLGCSQLYLYTRAASASEGWVYGWNEVRGYYDGTKNATVFYNVSPEEYTFWTQISPDEIDITISETVSNIPDGIGSLFPHAKTLHVSKSVRRIGDGAFLACDDLETVTIEPGVEYIGERAFMGCKITKIDLPNTLISMGEDTFWFCSRLKEVKLPGSLKVVPDGAFRECGNIRKVTLEDGIEELGNELFESSSGIAKLVIPASVHKIGYGLVSSNSSVRLEYGGTMREWAGMRPYMPAYCSDGYLIDGGSCGDFSVSTGEKVKWFITQVGKKYVLTVFGDGAIADHTDADDVGWAEYRNLIEEVVVEEGVDRIGECAFWGCTRLKKITLPESLECINQYAFSWCHSLKQIVIPKNVETIGYQAFYDCYNLTSINFLHDADSQLDIVDEAFITDGRTVSTVVRVGDKKNVNPSISGFHWKENRRNVSYGYLNCLEQAKGITLLLDGQPVDNNLTVDMSQIHGLTFDAPIAPEHALQAAQWASSAKTVATVDDYGVVTLLKPGTTTISATTVDGSKLTAKVTLNVTYLDAAKTLTAQCDAPSIGLELGKCAKLTVFGKNEIPTEYLRFSIPRNQEAIATVDENGIVTAGTQSGTVTITAEIKSDPLARKVSFKLKVIPKQIQALRVGVIDAEDWGIFTEDHSGATLTMDALVVKDQELRIPLLMEAQYDQESWEYTKAVKYSCSDASIVSVNADGVLTIKQKASGQCVVSIQSTDFLKTQTQLKIVVEDKSPRLETTALTVNTNLSDGLRVGLLESYGNAIQEVQMTDDRFGCTYENGCLQIKTNEFLKNGTYPMTLRVLCADEQTYAYSLTVKVANSVPKVTVKQPSKLNLFYVNGTAPLTVTSAGQTITDVTLEDTEDFILMPTEEAWELAYVGNTAKPDTKGTLYVSFEGYRDPVKVSLTVATVTTAPTVKLSAASCTVNAGQSLTAGFALLDKSGQPLALENPTLEAANANVQADIDGNLVTLTLEEAKTTTVTMTLQDSDWAKSVKLTYKINVSKSKPTLKPAGSLTVNRLFPEHTAETGMVLSQSNVSLLNVEIVPTAKEGSAAWTEAMKLSVSYDPDTGHVTAAIADPENLPKAGAYSFKCTGILETEETVPGGTLKITVSSTAPKVKLSTASVKLNRYLAGEEQGKVQVTVTGGYRVLDFEGMPAGMTYDAETGVLTTVLESNEDMGGSYTLYPVVRDLATGEDVTLTTKQAFKIQSYNSEKLTVSLSAKGKLDTQKESEILYTVSKPANCLEQVESVVLEGQDAERFQAELETVNGKPTVRLTLADGYTYATNKAYKVQFRFGVCGKQILSSVLTVKVTQTALKVTPPKTLTYYQAQRSALRCTLTLSAPLEELELDTGKTAKQFVEALGEMRWNGNKVEFEIANPAAMTAGKTYTVVLNATPKNNAENVKPVTVKLTVKVMK